MRSELDRVLFGGVAAVEALGLLYALVGGLAVSAWVAPRATRDVDLYSELPLQRREALQHELEARGFEVPAMQAELERFGVFRSRSRAEGVFLDIFDAVGPLGQAILDRRASISLGERRLWLATAEDLAVLKVFSDRSRDFEDLVALLAGGGPKLDRAYVEGWAHRLDEPRGSGEISQRLRRALQVASGEST